MTESGIDKAHEPRVPFEELGLFMEPEVRPAPQLNCHGCAGTVFAFATRIGV